MRENTAGAISMSISQYRNRGRIVSNWNEICNVLLDLCIFSFKINTMTAKYDHRGMNHTEGGWPREVHAADEEQTMRFRKKIEKDEMYIHTLVQLTHVSKIAYRDHKDIFTILSKIHV
jgi:hypothetical protein